MNFANVGDIYQANTAQSINVFAPAYSILGLSRPSHARQRRRRHPQAALAGLLRAGHDLRFDDRVHLLLGGRYDFAAAVNSVGQPNSAFVNNALMRADALAVWTKDQAFSPSVGLVVQPLPWLSLYGNYTKSFGVNNGVTRSNEPLGPQTAIQWEGGAKAEFFDRRLTATVAYFDIVKYNVAQNTPTAPNALRGYVYDLLDAGSRGVEVDVTGRVTDIGASSPISRTLRRM